MNGVLERTLEILKRKGMTEYQLCKEIGIKQSTFSTWKTEDRVPNTMRVARIANALGVSVDYLVTGKDESGNETPAYYLDPEAAEIAQELFERPELKVLFKASRKVSAEDIKVIQNMVDALARKDDE